jgi:hypothetical protein
VYLVCVFAFDLFIMFIVFFVFIPVPCHKSHESVKIGPHPRGQPSSYSWSRSWVSFADSKGLTVMKGICPRGNNKVVIILFRVHNRCLFFMLELY